MNEGEESSRLLYFGSPIRTAKAIRVLLDAFVQPDQQVWLEDLGTLEAVAQRGLYFSASRLFTVSNKYFDVDLVLECADDLSRVNLDRYDGVVFIMPDGKDPDKSYHRYLQHGSVQDMLFRLTIIDTKKKDFDIEVFVEDLPVYTETVAVDLFNYEIGTEKSEDLQRLIEGLGETMWRNHRTKEQPKGPNPKLIEYLQSQPDTPASHPEACSTPQPQTTEQKAELTENLFPQPPPLEDFEGDLEDDMKIFQDIMSFKMNSSGLSQQQRKQMADKLFSKLADQFGDQL